MLLLECVSRFRWQSILLYLCCSRSPTLPLLPPSVVAIAEGISLVLSVGIEIAALRGRFNPMRAVIRGLGAFGSLNARTPTACVNMVYLAPPSQAFVGKTFQALLSILKLCTARESFELPSLCNGGAEPISLYGQRCHIIS